MAGERQHHLPQFLQRGFTSRKTDRANFTWVYRRGKPPFESNIEHVGVERRFYTQGADSLVDDAITEAEATEFSRIVNSARAAVPGPIQIDGVPGLFAHLEVRSRQLRQRFGSTAHGLVQKAVKQAQHALPDLLLERWKRDPSSFDDLIKERLSEAGLAFLFNEELAEQMRAAAPKAMDEIRPHLMAAIEELTEVLQAKTAESAKGAHIEALNKTIAPEIRIAHYQGLKYSIVEFPVEDLILGDSAVIFEVEGARRFKPMSEKGDVILAAILPITSRRALVGSSESYTLDLVEIRNAIARCSHEFFIASQHTRTNEELIQEIGRDTELLSESELDDMVRAGIDELRQ